MNTSKLLALVALMSIVFAGCGKTSGLEGKVVDGKGQPLANAKVVASQWQPVKGYEQFETITGADGVFRFDRLFPASQYALSVWTNESGSTSLTTVQSGSKGETLVLAAPLELRFMISKDGWITDSRTDLMWAPAPDRNFNQNEADTYAKSLRMGGFSDWRLPTRKELKSLWKPSEEYKVHPAFRVTDRWAWSAEMTAPPAGWRIAIDFAIAGIDGPWNHDSGVLAVRSIK
jgi:hypothetical protein